MMNCQNKHPEGDLEESSMRMII